MASGREFLVDAVRQSAGNIITYSLNGATRSSGIWAFLLTGRFLYFTNWCPHGIGEPVYATVSFQGFLPSGVETFLTHSWLVGASKPLLPPHTTAPFKSGEGNGRFNLWKMWWEKWPPTRSNNVKTQSLFLYHIWGKDFASAVWRPLKESACLEEVTAREVFHSSPNFVSFFLPKATNSKSL